MPQCTVKSFFQKLLILSKQWLTVHFKTLVKIFLSLCSLSAVILVSIDTGISFWVRDRIYQDLNKLPYRPYGLVLGTAKYFKNNTLNLFYYNRLSAAEQLVKHHKVDYLLLSGDNRTMQYNEPQRMFKDLLKMGVPSQSMYFDYAGFRTLDSIIRADKVFNVQSLTIITQRFHCERALFIAKHYNLDAICFEADYPEGYPMVRIREFFARVQAVLDIILGKQPYFLGKPEPLPPPILPPYNE
ncbi:vancomycin high temperature exclusion protein [Gallibacterium trehalosifermentans]|uniref:Vancomycin high temperature exclusion protein n=1 Tax=Gallibacterium trehalosifermentans TaxID=516935 RepID=A0ABV6GXL5_9PAST